MKAVLIGGMHRLRRNYIEIFREFGIEVEIFNKWKGNMECKLRGADLVVVFTSMVSTNMSRKAVKVACRSGVPVVRIHKHSTSALKRCLYDLRRECFMERCKNCSERYECEAYGYMVLNNLKNPGRCRDCKNLSQIN